MAKTLLEVKNLKTHFFTDEGVVKAVDGLDYTIDEGATLGIVGESGSGKSVSSLSLMRLIAYPPGKIVDGEIIFQGTDLLKLPEAKMRAIRGNKISMIFQDPMTSLNPVLTIGDQIAEAIILHQKKNKREALEKAVHMLEIVKIPSAAKRINEYPHQFSGGMRQRVMIAMALSCEPALLIADEPTTALDVTIQAQILNLMRDLNQKLNSAIILITHDLGIVAQICQNVLVMYAGRIVEYADSFTIYKNPIHPYTKGLLSSVPRLDETEKKKLTPIKGQPPNLSHLPAGCSFAPRCDYVMPECKVEMPPLYEIDGLKHRVRCFLAKKS